MARAKRSYVWPHTDEVVARIADAERPEVRRRWHVIYLICRVDPKRKSPLKNKEIAAKVGLTEQQIGNIRRAFKERGPEAVDMGFSFARPNAGRKATLGQDNLEQLAASLRGIEKPGWEDVQKYCKDVLKKPVSNSTAQRRFRDYIAGKFQPPQVFDIPTTPETQAAPERTGTEKNSDDRLQPESEPVRQKPQPVTSSPPLESKPPVDSPARADKKKRAKRRLSKEEQIARQHPTLFDIFPDEQT